MSATKKLLDEKEKLKTMSKVELQQIIIKKKQCDARALAIVEQLLELNVNSDWLLQNLRFLSKCHMEDVIEERTILKLCGYALCSKPLTVIVRQQYRISTRSNKVYDISKRKRFCSSSCYAASNYLFEQMLDTPLWLRDKEDAPTFKILSMKPKSTQHIEILGDEVDIIGNKRSENVIDNVDENGRSAKAEGRRCDTIEQTEKDVSYDALSSEEEDTHSPRVLNDVNIEEAVWTEANTSINTASQRLLGCEANASQLHGDPGNKDFVDSRGSIKADHNDNAQEINIESENSEAKSIRRSKNVVPSRGHDTTDAEDKDSNECVTRDEDDKTLRSQPNDTDDKSDEIETSQLRLNKVQCSSSTLISSDSCAERRKRRDADKVNKTKKCKRKESNDVKNAPTDVHRNLVAHVEQSIREWVTERTLCLLLDDGDERNRLLEDFTQQERHERLCKKLNRLQVEDRMRDRANLEKDTLKPLPELSVLEEEGRKLNLKVRAFYEGQITFPLSEDSNKKPESKDDNDQTVVPLTESCAPNAVRRRIFLDKLDTILPDLLHTLINNANVSSMMQCTHNNERYSLIKILVSTFDLSAENIAFKTAEWTLAGLIIIKMLSLIDAKLQSSLRLKQASMYMSMMLTLYKLDSTYLDRFVTEIINDANASKSSDKN